jgi:predicted nucleic acid-binding protein
MEDEPHRDRALVLRDQFINEKIELWVPALWRYEVGNTLARKYPNQALAHLQFMQMLGMHEPSHDDRWLDKTLAIATRYKVAFYDAAYHAVAINAEGMLVTADERYLKAVGAADAICHIADWRA